ncbi:zinc finger protein 91-like isoform X11 [Achroia grisella]|uniref:zinc finger protein 91-like isoform X11 n=1 Tax=Achroia grisella TaxID=688607 RepID=UPI0027D2BFEF|nr:zinc finger protein 91-like isoform X11 [Achroia grisella]
MDTTMNHGMCRCCASEGTFKNLSNAYQWMGQEEIYSDMLKECFDISLTTAEPGEEGGICEVCITQLRNAANFKKQVQHTEVQFKKCLQDKLFKSDLIKVEATNLDDGDDSDNDNNLSDNFSGNEFDMAIKKEKEDPKPKKRVATRASTSRAKKSKVDDGEPSTKRIASGTKVSRTEANCDLSLRRIPQGGNASQYFKIKQNLKNILINSNANPIRSKDGNGYSCGFCPKKFPETKNLKTHFDEEHNNNRLIKHLTPKFFRTVVKLDITLLNCSLCKKELDDLNDLMAHLNLEHDVKIYTDIKNPILPFRFDSEELCCAICKITHTSFKRMQEHMSRHFQNYMCEVCGTGFVIERLLKHHMRTHENGEYKCAQCDKTFTNNVYMQRHLKITHLGYDKRNICQYCPERFVDYCKKLSHMVKVHGQQPVVLKCKGCDRTFENQRSLSRHTKKDHLLERKHECQECHMRFFTNSSLKKHMTKHSGLRQFKCEVCHKAYGRKNTLREHMRIHNNDRRFACTFCGQAFVQKCSWKSHMWSKHEQKV